MALKSLVAAGFLTLAALTPAWAQEARVTFVLANDIYKVDNDAPRGGFGRLAAVAAAERAANPSTLVVLAGDFLSPSLLSGFDEGEHIVALLNAIGPDVVVPGNHEFDFGEAVFRARMAELDGTEMAANMRDSEGAPLEGFEDTRLVEMAGVRIGIVGLTADDSPVKSSPGTLTFSDTIETGVTAARALREAGAEFIVAVAHANREQDRQLVETRAFDLVLSGDDHDLMIFFDGRTALVESGEEAEYVTAIDINFSVSEADGRRRVRWWPNFRPIDTTGLAPAADVQALIDGYNAELSEELDVELATLSAELDSRRASVRGSEATMGNLVADAMRAATGADIAITNGGGIRADRLYPAGTALTRRDVLSELPFGNVNIMIELSGADVLEALENGFSRVEDAQGRFPQISGMRIVVDLTREPGSRIVEARVGDTPLDPAATYRVATNDYMGRGGDGYSVFTEAPRILREEDAKLMANDVMVFLRNAGTYAPALDGRIELRR
ncbi:MAG: 5'-nucleotidase C-terminal domain-containing protein [Hyphomicrobiaceae bacterium]|nr:5'-nucleotidase C-terminal domain-containing protein [Hyphomicrobiaceae bacterium]